MSLFQYIGVALGGSGDASGLSSLRNAVDARFSTGASDSELAQWLSLANGIKSTDLQGIDTIVASKTYLIGGSFGIADVALYVGLATSKETVQWGQYPSLARYIAHVQCLCKIQQGIALLNIPQAPTPVPVGCGIALAKSKATAAAAPSAAGSSAAAPEAAAQSTAVENSDKKEKKEKKEKSAPAAATATASPESNAAATAPAASEEALEPSLLDMRVGIVLKCWNHPDSEKLLCEEVDVGEAAPRSIASGIRAFYSAEEFVGKKVLVLANLKGRAIAGFKSEGMVLCACNDDHSKVAIVEPPANAKAGDKVQFAGFEGREAASANNVAKKKILEKLGPLLKTDATGTAFCGKDQFLINGQAVTSTMCSATIS